MLSAGIVLMLLGLGLAMYGYKVGQKPEAYVAFLYLAAGAVIFIVGVVSFFFGLG